MGYAGGGGCDCPFHCGDGFADRALVCAAVERKFEIIGEALSQLSKRDPVLAHRVPDFRDIISFRNLLIHGYSVVNQDAVRKLLPGLRAVPGDLPDELGPP